MPSKRIPKKRNGDRHDWGGSAIIRRPRGNKRTGREESGKKSGEKRLWNSELISIRQDRGKKKPEMVYNDGNENVCNRTNARRKEKEEKIRKTGRPSLSRHRWTPDARRRGELPAIGRRGGPVAIQGG